MKILLYTFILLFSKFYCSTLRYNQKINGVRKNNDELLRHGTITIEMENLPHIEYIHLENNAMVTYFEFNYTSGDNSSSLIETVDGGSGLNFIKLLLFSGSGIMTYHYKIYGYHKTLPVHYNQLYFGVRENFDKVLVHEKIGILIDDEPDVMFINFNSNNVIITHCELNYTSGDNSSSNIVIEKIKNSLKLLIFSESDYAVVEYKVYGLLLETKLNLR